MLVLMVVTEIYFGAILIGGLCFAWTATEVSASYVIWKKQMKERIDILFKGAREGRGHGLRPVRFHPFLNFVPTQSPLINGINERGFRSVGPNNGFQGTRIYIAGDCTAFDAQLPAESSLGLMLEATLNKSSECQLEVINAGCSHYTSLHSLNGFMIDIQRFSFDVGIFMTGINDVLSFVHTGGNPDPDYANFYRAPKDGRDPLDSLALRYSWLFNLLPSLRLYAFSTQWSTLTDWDRQVLILDKNYTSPANLEKCYANFHTRFVRANLRAYIVLCRLYGITPVLMTNYYQPEDMIEPVRQFYAHGIDRANDEIRHTAITNNVLLLDMANEFPREPGLVDNKWHFTCQGNVERVKIISDFLKYHDLLTVKRDLADIPVV